jgi:phenylpyruvate tautomerase PptA (4-oxalocrotonate tautomerase family)
MIEHKCRVCVYNTHKICDYNKHLLTKKHIKNVMLNPINNNLINKIDIITENQSNLAKQNAEVIKQNDELRKEIQKLKEVSNENTNKIVKEARTIKKSILSVLNTNFKDTPSIDYIEEKDFRIEFEEEYNLKLNDPENKIFMRIFSDFKKRKLIQSLSNVIVRIIKKEDQNVQSVFNIDASRGNYATKIEDIWHNDKKGMQLKKYTIDVITNYMINIMDIYRSRLVDMYNENKIKKNINVTDYIMECQGLLFDVNAFLTNPNTHKRIILNMCPELRIDDKFLE